MSWSLLAVVLALAQSLVAWGLEYRWNDRRRTEHRRARGILLAVTVAVSVAAILYVASEERAAARREASFSAFRAEAATAASKAEASAAEAAAQLAALRGDVESLGTRLAPFAAASRRAYPNMSEEAALKQLSEDIAALEARASRLEAASQDLAVRDNFRPLDAARRAAAVRAFVGGQTSGSGAMSIAIDVQFSPGSRAKVDLAKQLAAVLKDAGYDARCCNTLIEGGDLPAVRIRFHPGEDRLVQALAPGLGQLINIKAAQGLPDVGVPPRTLSLDIFGQPVFDASGFVTFR